MPLKVTFPRCLHLHAHQKGRSVSVQSWAREQVINEISGKHTDTLSGLQRKKKWYAVNG